MHSEFLTVLGDPGVVPHLFSQENMNPKRRQASDAMFSFVGGVYAGRDSSWCGEFLTVLGGPGVVPNLSSQENLNPKRQQVSDASFSCQF